MRAEDGWIKVRLVPLTRLLTERRRGPRGRRVWRWKKVRAGSRAKLHLVSPRGVEWEFRALCGSGTWMRRAGPAGSEFKV